MSESHTLSQNASSSSYVLDTLETTQHVGQTPLPAGSWEGSDDTGVSFRHSGWDQRRRCVQLALSELADSEGRRNRFDSCGRHSWVLRSVEDPDVYRIACDKCKDRFCQPCSQERARHIAQCVGDFSQGKELRLITLTLRQTDNTIADDVDRLYAGFVKLRRRVLWTKSQKGGVFFIEIKRRRGGAGWHTHMHVLSEGYWIKKSALSQMWLEITGDSFIVDVKFCDSGEDAARYVAKYAGKGVHGSCYHDADVLREAIVAIKGRRLVGKFGTWRELSFDHDVPPGEWVGVDSLRRLVRRSVDGDLAARFILAVLKGDDSCDTEPRSPPVLGECPSLFHTSHDAPAAQNSFSRAS